MSTRESGYGPVHVADGGRSRRGMRRRSAVMLIALAALVAVLAADSGLLWVVVGFVGFPVLGLAIVAAAALLGLVGFGLFAAGDRVASAYRRAGRWPDEEQAHR